MRKGLAWLAVAGAAGGAAVWRRSRERRREHVDVYFADGSMISLPEGTEQGGRLLPLAREVLEAAR